MAGFLVHRGFAKQHNLHLLTPTHEDMAWLANCKGCSSQPIDLCKKTTEAATHPPHPPTLILDVCQSVESDFFNRESKVVHKPFRRPQVPKWVNPPILKSGGEGGKYFV